MAVESFVGGIVVESYEEFVKKAKAHRDKYMPKKSFQERCQEQDNINVIYNPHKCKDDKKSKDNPK
jgi:hypothetical protein